MAKTNALRTEVFAVRVLRDDVKLLDEITANTYDGRRADIAREALRRGLRSIQSETRTKKRR